MALYWIRPYTYINLDEVNKKFITNFENMPAGFVESIKDKIKSSPDGKDYLYIKDVCKKVWESGEYEYKNFLELSYYVRKDSETSKQKTIAGDNNNSSNTAFLRWFKPVIQALHDLGGSATPAEVHAK